MTDSELLIDISNRMIRLETRLDGTVDISKISFSFKGASIMFFVLITSAVIPAVANYTALTANYKVISSKIDVMTDTVTKHIKNDRIHCEGKI